MESSEPQTDVAVADTTAPDDSDDETQSSIDYDQCLSTYVFSEVAGSDFLNVDGGFIETYTGGPQGGYLFSADGKTYEVNREWFKAFTLKEIEGAFKFAIMTSKIVRPTIPDSSFHYLRILRDGQELTEEEQEFHFADWHPEIWERAKANYEETLEALRSDSSSDVSSDEDGCIAGVHRSEYQRKAVTITLTLTIPDDPKLDFITTEYDPEEVAKVAAYSKSFFESHLKDELRLYNDGQYDEEVNSVDGIEVKYIDYPSRRRL